MKTIEATCPIHGATDFEATGVLEKETEVLIQCRCLKCSHPKTRVLTETEYQEWLKSK